MTEGKARPAARPSRLPIWGQPISRRVQASASFEQVTASVPVGALASQVRAPSAAARRYAETSRAAAPARPAETVEYFERLVRDAQQKS